MTEKVSPRGGEKRRSRNGGGGVTANSLCDKCKGEQRGLYLGAVIMPRRSISHPLKRMIGASKRTLIRNNNNYCLSAAFCLKSIKFFAFWIETPYQEIRIFHIHS